MFNIKKTQKESERFLVGNYGKRFPYVFDRGRGAYLFDKNGKKYLDFLSGIAVNSLGYSHPKMKRVMKKMASSVWHTSNFFEIESQIELAKLLSKHSFAGKTLFCNSGTEANEAAYKLAMKYGASFNEAKTEIVALTGAFHGRTLGALSLTANEKYKKDFPHAGRVLRAEFNDVDSLTNVITEKTAAVFIEIIQGESGINEMSNEFYRAVRSLTRKYKALMIVDEVQTGLGRTGKLFAYQHYGPKPDIITLAKGLGAGVPIGAMHSAERPAAFLAPGTHGTTFGGNPLCASVGAEVMRIVSRASFMSNVKNTSSFLFRELFRLKEKYPFIKDIRGKGFMLGVELSVSANSVRDIAMAEGLIVNAIGDKVIRMLPPLIVNKNDVREALKKLDIALSKV